MNTFLRTLLASLSATLLLAVLWTGCSDNPADHGNDDDHFEARGVALRINGLDTVVVDSNRIKQGRLVVKEGTTSPHISVEFIRESDGTRGTPDTGDKDHTLGWSIADTSVAEVEHEAEDGEWSLHIVGKKAGQTTIIVRMLHNDHPDFESIPIPVEVTP